MYGSGLGATIYKGKKKYTDYSKKENISLVSISDFIEECVQGYDTLIGEKGVSLSGGQKQRIAIARALYKKSSILVFDEATSALDDDTEKSVVSSIELLGHDITTITIAHRLSTVANCDLVYKLNKGSIEDEGSPKDIL